ncbi:hypothetical protein JXB31_05905, partial [Candidatus Woesearchaeota archaeon]|nr:hypothetical protein [Candidatus Woesearchaeota archaeon]
MGEVRDVKEEKKEGVVDIGKLKKIIESNPQIEDFELINNLGYSQDQINEVRDKLQADRIQ